MKKLLLSTAVLASLSLPALAETTLRSAFLKPAANHVRASDMIGMRVYASEAKVDADSFDGAQDGWEDIGEINDVVIGRSGDVTAVLLDIGGFLGVGERQVAVTLGALRFVGDDATADVDDDYFLVLNTPRAALEEAPEYKWETLADNKADAGEAAPAEAAAKRQHVTRDGYVATPHERLTADTLQGASVYGSDDTRIGEVGEIVLNGDGQVSHMVIDVGGFLGMGEKPVALEPSALDILQREDGSDLRVYVPMTHEQLEALPKHNG